MIQLLQPEEEYPAYFLKKIDQKYLDRRNQTRKRIYMWICIMERYSPFEIQYHPIFSKTYNKKIRNSSQRFSNGQSYPICQI